MFQSFTLNYIIVLQATAATISPDPSQQRHFNYSDSDSESEDEPSGLRSTVTVVQVSYKRCGLRLCYFNNTREEKEVNLRREHEIDHHHHGN